MLDNALRYSPDDTSIEVQLLQEGRWERIEVRDCGEGFSPEDLQHMFDRFYRGDPSRSRGKRVGSGLGLAIVEQIAHSHGGHIKARNHPEGGAVVQLRCLQTRHEQRAPTAAKGALSSWCLLEAARRRADAPRPRAAQWPPGQPGDQGDPLRDRILVDGELVPPQPKSSPCCCTNPGRAQHLL